MSEPDENDECVQHDMPYVTAVIILGVIPNLVLFAFGVLAGILAIIPTFLYVTGMSFSEVLLWAVVSIGVAVLNLWAFRERSVGHVLITSTALTASAALVLLSLWEWKHSFEDLGSFAVPITTGTRGAIGMTSVFVIVSLRIVRRSESTFTLKHVFAFVEHLAHLSHLYYLHLPGTQVSREGIDWLHKRLPNCRIYATPNGEDYSVGR